MPVQICSQDQKNMVFRMTWSKRSFLALVTLCEKFQDSTPYVLALAVALHSGL